MAKRTSMRVTKGPSIEQLKGFVRREGAAYLQSPNINSVGIGLKVDSKRGQTDTVCIQFTVDRKASPEHLESLGTRLIPPLVNVEGHLVPTDVIERRFTPTYRLVDEAITQKDPRKIRHDTLQPGISISNPKGTAGTLGAIVYDRRSGSPLLLSNWHVLQGAGANIGDIIVQPGPYDDNQINANRCGKLLRSHLGAAGDCAVASIEGRLYKADVLDLNVAPTRVGKAELKDIVVKSGRTTGITYGRVTRVEVQSKIDYDKIEVTVGGFEITVDPKHKPETGEISSGGDSGACWLAVDPKTDKPTDIMLGLHYAGETADERQEYALACYAHSVLEKLECSLTPEGAKSTLERVTGLAERMGRFGGPGYDEGFVGVKIALPKPKSSIAKDIVGADGTKIAHYTHYSLAMRKSKRLAAFVAWNIDGSNITKPNDKSAAWATDDRIPEEAQIGPVLYDATVFDKGHIAKREDLLWGGAANAKRANDDSFCYANATPQHEHFNRLAPALWKSLEDEIYRQVKVERYRISVFGGPIFQSDDREFTPRRSPADFKPIAIPREFYKIIAYVDEDSGDLNVHAFTLSQAELIRGRLESVVPEALDFEEFKMYQVSVSSLETLTHIDFGVLAEHDTGRTAGIESLRSGVRVHQVERFGDIKR